MAATSKKTPTKKTDRAKSPAEKTKGYSKIGHWSDPEHPERSTEGWQRSKPLSEKEKSAYEASKPVVKKDTQKTPTKVEKTP